MSAFSKLFNDNDKSNKSTEKISNPASSSSSKSNIIDLEKLHLLMHKKSFRYTTATASTTTATATANSNSNN